MPRPELLRGWRAYEVRWMGRRGLALVGLAHGLWEGPQLRAECHHPGTTVFGPYPVVVADYLVPGDAAEVARRHLLAGRCLCGIYGVWDLSDLPEWEQTIPPRHGVRAAAIGWGAAVIGEHGWRAEWARIERLWLNPACAACDRDATVALFAGKGSAPLLLCHRHRLSDFERLSLATAAEWTVEEMRESLAQRYGVPVDLGEPPRRRIVA